MCAERSFARPASFRFAKAIAAAVVASVFSAALAPMARAEISITLDRGTFQPLPIAITDFGGSDPNLGSQISGVITNNLKRSGVFAPIDKKAFVEKTSNPDVAPQFDSWKVINAQALVTGRITRDASGRFKAEFRLWDVLAGQQLMGQQYFTDPNNWRRVAHIISDAIYSRLTGDKGFFDSGSSSWTRPARRRTVKSASQSWIRMASTSATSRAAMIWW